jgi:hypothetical protein
LDKKHLEAKHKSSPALGIWFWNARFPSHHVQSPKEPKTLWDSWHSHFLLFPLQIMNTTLIINPKPYFKIQQEKII